MNANEIQIMVALASGAGPYIERVREAQLGTWLVNLRTVDAMGLRLEPDRLHLTTTSQVTLGEIARFIDDYMFSNGSRPTSLNKFLPIKVYIFHWCLLLNRLLTKDYLIARDIDVSCSFCPICGDDAKEVNNLLVHCEVTKDMISKLKKWCDVSFSSFALVFDLDHFLLPISW
ncbi:unnamed protein product [Lactuca saligna]|uniref:Reverse transcriptase zinc-binding domain-containing protein n=1 Tax=Lactuca saligna TaxID=75948 RepID=A0AA35YXX6_LACSI|nr:unnamed protein product [Lactuca saligna]